MPMKIESGDNGTSKVIYGKIMTIEEIITSEIAYCVYLKQNSYI